jgi:hypothetical protein
VFRQQENAGQENILLLSDGLTKPAANRL